MRILVCFSPLYLNRPAGDESSSVQSLTVTLRLQSATRSQKGSSACKRISREGDPQFNVIPGHTASGMATGEGLGLLDGLVEDPSASSWLSVVGSFAIEFFRNRSSFSKGFGPLSHAPLSAALFQMSIIVHFSLPQGCGSSKKVTGPKQQTLAADAQ